ERARLDAIDRRRVLITYELVDELAFQCVHVFASRSLSDLLSRMRCTAKKRWMLGARCSVYREYAQAEQRRRRAFWQQPEGTGRFGRISALLALAILPVCLRARALNCAQTATVACAKASPTGSRRAKLSM